MLLKKKPCKYGVLLYSASLIKNKIIGCSKTSSSGTENLYIRSQVIEYSRKNIIFGTVYGSLLKNRPFSDPCL